MCMVNVYSSTINVCFRRVVSTFMGHSVNNSTNWIIIGYWPIGVSVQIVIYQKDISMASVNYTKSIISRVSSKSFVNKIFIQG